MGEKFSGEQFLSEKYPDLPGSEPVERAVKSQNRKGEKEPQSREGRVGAYLERIKNIIEGRITEEGRQIEGKEKLRHVLHEKFITQDISDDYLRGVLLGNLAEQMGHTREDLSDSEIKKTIEQTFAEHMGTPIEEYQIPAKEKQETIAMLVGDQESRLDEWYDYLTSEEARNYPDAFRYWAFSQILKLGSYDSIVKNFSKRKAGKTAAPFPELNQQALAIALDEVLSKRTGRKSTLEKTSDQHAELEERLKSENFGELYGWSLDYVKSLKFSQEKLGITKGEWRTFRKGDSEKLVKAIGQYPTQWCIAGHGTAEGYLNHSEILIYFTVENESLPPDEATAPRLAIVSNGEKITEVRGIFYDETTGAKQHPDQEISQTDILSDKLQELPGGQAWESGAKSMKELANVYRKHARKEELEKNDLAFIYELDKPIQDLGYGRDPRIQEIREGRQDRVQQDMGIIFECEKSQIASNLEQISESTKAYVGSLEPGIFQRLEEFTIEHIYTSFPEGKIKRRALEIGGTSKESLVENLKNKGFKTYSYAQSMIDGEKFTVAETKEEKVFFSLTVKDLGFTEYATLKQIYDRASELGLDLCPAETGPQLRLQYSDQPLGEYIYIGMDAIPDSDDHPSLFYVEHDGDGLYLRSGHGRPDRKFYPDHRFLFASRKYKKPLDT